MAAALVCNRGPACKLDGVDGRIEAGFRYRFAALLANQPTATREGEVERLIAEGRAAAAAADGDLVRALLREHERLRTRVSSGPEPSRPGRDTVGGVDEKGGPGVSAPPCFLCDASLGGLARWLRAAGYEAELAPEVPPKRQPEEAVRRSAVLLTTDAEVLDRRLVADGALRVLWLPTSLHVEEKLVLVLRDLGLALREPRCMACGGPLVARAKAAVLARIPPRTARWKDEYFVCAACDRLYWQGTHWERIAAALHHAASDAA
jgi:uncharacterized protein with PIN domain